MTYLANPYDSPQKNICKSGLDKNYTGFLNTTFDGLWNNCYMRWGCSWVQVTGPPNSFYLRPSDADKVLGVLREEGHLFVWSSETLQRCQAVLGEDLNGVEVANGWYAYGRAYEKKLGCLSLDDFLYALIKGIGYEGEVRVWSYGQKAKMGSGGLECMKLVEREGEGGGIPWRIDVGIGISAKRALIEDGKGGDITQDGSVIRPIAFMDRGKDGITKGIKRSSYSNGGVVKGGNLVVDFKKKPRSGRDFGKERGDEIFDILGVKARPDLRMVKLKVYDFRFGHGQRTELGKARKIVTSNLLGKLGSVGAFRSAFNEVSDGFLYHLGYLAREPGLWRVEIVVEGDWKASDLRALTLEFARPGGNVLGRALRALRYELQALTMLESIDSLVLPAMRMENLYGLTGMGGWDGGAIPLEEAYLVSGCAAAIMGLCTKETAECVSRFYRLFLGEGAHIPWIDIASVSPYSRAEFMVDVVGYHKGRDGGRLGKGYYVQVRVYWRSIGREDAM
jgi:hypothetical protein